MESVEAPKERNLRWAYAVTTVPSRRKDLLPKTLVSLAVAGFDSPRLFVDGDKDAVSWEKEFGMEVSCRYPNVRTFGNWMLSLWELYLRNPTAQRYAIFQDDFITSRNLRRYLNCVPYPDKGYLNLFTFNSNQRLAPKTEHGGTQDGFYLSNQYGRGAVALVFSLECVVELLASRHMSERPQDSTRGHKAVDGAIVTALAKAGWKEYVHSPSLVQHTGEFSSMANRPHQPAESFRGQDYDLLDLLRKK